MTVSTQRPSASTMPAKLRDVVKMFWFTSSLFTVFGTCCLAPVLFDSTSLTRDPLGWIFAPLPMSTGVALGVTAYFLKRRRRWAWRSAATLAATIAGLLLVYAAVLGTQEFPTPDVASAVLAAGFALAYVVALIKLLHPECRGWFPDPHTGLLPEDRDVF